MTASSTFDASTRTGVADAKGAPWLAGLALLILLTPAYFLVGDILLDPGRVFFALMTPWLVIQLLSGMYREGIRLTSPH